MKRTPAVAPVIEPGAPTGLGAWFDRCLALRDRWLASPVFQRRATAFAPTRWLARRRAGHLFDLVAGFVYSQALTAAVRLRLFEVLAEAPQPAEALAERLALHSIRCAACSTRWSRCGSSNAELTTAMASGRSARRWSATRR